MRGYTSPEGLVSAVSEDTSQVLDISYLVNTCRTCNMIEASKAAGEIDDRAYYGKLVKHHKTCSKNHDGGEARRNHVESSIHINDQPMRK